MTGLVIAAFNLTAGQNVASPHLHVIYKASTPTVDLAPSSGPPLREIEVADASGRAVSVIFQHKFAALNNMMSASIAARNSKSRSDPSATPRPVQQPTPTDARQPVRQNTPSSAQESANEAPFSASRPSDDHDLEHESATEASPTEMAISVGEVNVEPSQVNPSQTNDVDMTASSSPNLSDTPDDAPLEEHPMTSQRDLQLVTGNQFGPAAKLPSSLSPRSAPLLTNNRYAILEEEDVELSMDDFVLPRIVLTDANFPRPTKVQGKKQRANKSKHAHLERAQRAIRDEKVVRSIVECKSILLQEPQIIAHSINRAIEREMAKHTLLDEEDNYKAYLGFYTQNYVDPSQILAEIVPESHKASVRLAVAAMDLFLENRAPNLYNMLTHSIHC
ncbi:hypothetical protein H310_15216 [Aphanomyces invadans]|uniref:Uncharacterized protein n=1 Tax=Aphanomyces invadans TaxID=157072 RepID=A0A024T9F6_9STRA|nr:hypothetical protein H310_15216 [Aphanomyces invadans]ETV89942.1 hypothetical protein H310_15216 [Aphanomyces invadans]|eukprot:XP_008881426.1 hypothetical protein H310_15216 [Aphanomyces invadans]